MPKSVCMKCEVELRPEENGVVVADMFQGNQKVYRLWSADLWKCPLCGIEIVLGFAKGPFMIHHEGDIEAKLNELLLQGKTIIKDKEVLNR